jgi:deoxyribodipyrimidine photo-lyase
MASASSGSSATCASTTTPLHAAALRGPLLCLYVVEPSLWAEPDAARQHYGFMLESLRDLYRALRQLGGGCTWSPARWSRCWAPPRRALRRAVFPRGDRQRPSFQRDIAVARWCRTACAGRSFPSSAWCAASPTATPGRPAGKPSWPALPAAADAALRPLPWPDAAARADALGLRPPIRPTASAAGAAGLAVLHDFLTSAAAVPGRHLVAPVGAHRLLAPVALPGLGCLSLREWFRPPGSRASLPAGARRNGLTAFISRLHWHCHFIQKLESEPELEFRNLHRGYDGLREADWNPAHFDALTAGRTGWPLVDACVAMLRDTGWINFRMRAMLVSVAAYPCGCTGARSGCGWRGSSSTTSRASTGARCRCRPAPPASTPPRVYNPIKQARDHDPKGRFVRRWLPALRPVPDAGCSSPGACPPHCRPPCGLRPATSRAAGRAGNRHPRAKARLFALRAQPEVRAAKAAIVARHGSRKRRPAAPAPGKPPTRLN